MLWFKLGEMLQLLGQCLLLDLQLLRVCHVLQTAATTQFNVRTTRLLTLWTTLLQAFQACLDQLATRPDNPGGNLLAGQTALDKGSSSSPAADAAAIVGQALKRKLDALANRSRRVGDGGCTRATATALHTGPSYTPVDR
ncbi:hypothetical protein GCM10007421_13550 [Halopseudomonas oceani]|nr:hypothetical protein GCM10007421_13550 [Halopseudomonas oceani]